MTREEMNKTRFRSYMEINYINERIKNVDGGDGVIVPCLLVAIDFDEEILKLQIIPNDFYHAEIKSGTKQSDFWAHISHCFLPEKKKEGLKIKINNLLR